MFITTFSGVEFNVLEPRPKDVRLVDIAHALSNQGRWLGHTRWFYSVAEHSVRASYMVPQRFRLAVLLHDASEAYTGDCPTPIKHSTLMEPFRRIEARVQIAIGEHFGIDFLAAAQAIHYADALMRDTEGRDLKPHYILSDDMVLDSDRIIPMSSQLAKGEFLRRFFELRRA